MEAWESYQNMSCQANHLFSLGTGVATPNSASGLKSHLDTFVPRQKKGLGVILPKGKRPFSLYFQIVEGRAKGGVRTPEQIGCPQESG